MNANDTFSSDGTSEQLIGVTYGIDNVNNGSREKQHDITCDSDAISDSSAGGLRPLTTAPPQTPLTTENLAVHNLESGGGVLYSINSAAVKRDSSPKKVYATSQTKARSYSPGMDHLSSFLCQSLLGREKIGNMQVLYKNSEGEPKIMMGSYWPCCLFVTFPLTIAPVALIHFYLLPSLPFFYRPILWTFTFLTLLGLAFVSCRNPGIIEQCDVNDKESNPQKENWVWNDRVKSFRPPTAIYSMEADLVVEDYDHFCPWTGTAIGKR